MNERNQVGFEELLETCLHGQSPLERDEARTQLIRHSDPRRVPIIMEFLDAPQRLVRRRAVRLLGDIDPPVARPYIERAFRDASTNPRIVVALARMLTSQTKADEPLLGDGLNHEESRIRQACATRAAPVDDLTKGLLDREPTVRNKCASALNDLEAVVPMGALEAMCKVLTKSDEDCQRLLLRCAPEHHMISTIELANACALDFTNKPEVVRVHPTASEIDKAWALSRLASVSTEHAVATDARIRQAYARSTSAKPETLQGLLKDEDAGARWLAQRALENAFDKSILDERTAPHARLSVPSAQPPFGIRSGDERIARQRVKAGLALCHGRIDVNIGVAVRSAEAAGFSHVFIVGTRPLMRTPMRGTDSVVSLQMVSDGPSLVRAARNLGFQLVAVQQTPCSEQYHQADYPPHPLFMMGAEDMGLPDSLRVAADLAVEIPMFGEIDSLNVATAATTVMFHWRLHCAPILAKENSSCT